MRFLAALTDACGGETGGALASVLHRHLSHGDPALVATVRHLLSKVGGAADAAVSDGGV